MIKLIQNLKLKRLLKQPLGNSEEEILGFIAALKKLDQSILFTIYQIRSKLKMDVDEARDVVLNSPSWISEKGYFLEFNEEFCENLKEVADKVEVDKDGTINYIFDLRNGNNK